MTGLPVEHRFENHKNSYKSAWTVKKYGIRLLPELYEHLNPMPFEAAAQMEKDLTEDLRAEGYTVTGGNVTNHCTCDMPAQQKGSSEREPDREQEIRASSMLIPDIFMGDTIVRSLLDEGYW